MESDAKPFEMWWPGTELNRRRQPFQGCALPPELPGHSLLTVRPATCVSSRVHAMTVAGLPTANSQRWERGDRHDYSNETGIAPCSRRAAGTSSARAIWVK